MGLLEKANYTFTTNKEEAEVLIVNTCSFIDAAKQESIDTILEMAEHKKQGTCKRLIVTGCLVERYRKELAAELPEIDALLGTNEVEKIVDAVAGRKRRSLPVLNVTIDEASVATSERSSAYLYTDATPRKLTTASFTAYIKISEGCDHPCTFCIIPKLRGSFRSRRPESIIREAERLAEQGVKEIVLVAQDSTYYGEDLGLRDGLAHLLRSIVKVDGIEWIRFLYSYPSRLSDKVLDVIAEESKVCKYVDIPLQHASSRMLKAMKRPGNRRYVEQLVERIRRRVPGITLRTTFIVGFPGETEEDFEELMDFCRQAKFERLGAFVYSDEEGTDAYEFEDKVPTRTALSRQKRLMQLQSQISRRLNKRLVGKTFRALFEGCSKETELLWQARLESQAPEIDGYVLINDAAYTPMPGSFVNVEITQAYDYDLVGRIV